MNEPPSLPSSAPAAPKTRAGWLTAAGFGAGCLLAALPFSTRGTDRVPFMLFDLFAVPAVALVLSIIRSTRSFGVGLLLACGLGWLVLLGICAGVFR